MNKLNFIHVATFGPAIGLRGEIKLNLLTSSIDVFKSIDHYYNFDSSIEWKFNSIVLRKDKCIGHPSHCKSRNDAEALRNQKIFSSKDFFSSTKINEYYVVDLIDCEIKHKNGALIGKVINLDNFGAGDLLETVYKSKKIYIPMNEDNVLSVDIEKKIIIINPIQGILEYD